MKNEITICEPAYAYGYDASARISYGYAIKGAYRTHDGLSVSTTLAHIIEEKAKENKNGNKNAQRK